LERLISSWFNGVEGEEAEEEGASTTKSLVPRLETATGGSKELVTVLIMVWLCIVGM